MTIFKLHKFILSKIIDFIANKLMFGLMLPGYKEVTASYHVVFFMPKIRLHDKYTAGKLINN